MLLHELSVFFLSLKKHCFPFQNVLLPLTQYNTAGVEGGAEQVKLNLCVTVHVAHVRKRHKCKFVQRILSIVVPIISTRQV